MEQMLNQSLEQANQLWQVLETAQNQISQLEVLFAYYGSPEWREHFELDKKGQIPMHVPRGEVSEDGIYNVILDYREIVQTMRIIANNIEQAILPEE